MFSISHSVEFKKLDSYLKKLEKLEIKSILDRYGKRGVAALKEATPKNSGETADLWTYEVRMDSESASLVFKNNNIQNGVPVVILIQYGHATKNGGYVEGNDFINPTMTTIFNDIAKAVWEEVKR